MKKKTYYGKHFILAGGKCDETDSEDEPPSDDDHDDDVATEADANTKSPKSDEEPPVGHFTLPTSVLYDIVKAYKGTMGTQFGDRSAQFGNHWT